ncbi:hypothetical protein ACFVIY_39785 [Streptomyces sp. NPDC127166]|uniref:hypothetical protein n=1 Tax=Streptomyces sp. NPDC127166 TaxID=3345380 RepID=UPI00363C8E3B
MTPMEELKRLAQTFVDGQDRSMELVGEIEGILVSNFLGAELFESLAEAVSLYRPGEGLPYYDEEEMKLALQESLGINPSNT